MTQYGIINESPCIQEPHEFYKFILNLFDISQISVNQCEFYSVKPK